jgi:hypothetical protein
MNESTDQNYTASLIALRSYSFGVQSLPKNGQTLPFPMDCTSFDATIPWHATLSYLISI